MLGAKHIQNRNFTPNGQKPKKSLNEYKLDPAESQELKQQEQNSVIMSKGHACDTFAGRRGW